MNVYIGKSKLHGKGIFASRNIKKGDTLFIIKGELIKFLINSQEKAKIAGLNWIGYGKNTWIDPINYGLFINHSCKPNAFIKGRVTVVALYNIKKNEEITMDYSFNESDIFYKIICNCGSIHCRLKINSIQFSPKNVFNKNKSFIPKFYQNIYKKFNIYNFKNIKEFQNNWLNYINKNFRV